MSEILWQPSADLVCKTAMTQFRREINYHAIDQLDDFDALYRWSIDHPEEFWPQVWRFCGIRASRRWDRVLDGGDRMPGARWFPGARLNFAENLLRHRGSSDALVFRDEKGHQRRLSHDELFGQVARLTDSLRGAGVGPGDRVAGLMPNLPETVVAMLATTSLGGIWSSCSPDFGAQGIWDRFGQIQPKVLFAADGYHFGGKRFDSLELVSRILQKLPSLEQVVIVPYLIERPDLSTIGRSIPYPEFLGPATVTDIDFAQLPFDHPLYIMFSSGTTGLPKCMVHSAGGTLIQHLKEHVLHCDLGTEDRIFYYTTCGWMMWNWLVSSLATGAAVLLYDGSPLQPETGLWDYAEQERMTLLGTSPKYLTTIEKRGLRPGRSHDLSALRTILSTGSVLLPETYDFVYRDIKSDLQLSSITGGTDIISTFALGNPILPVRRGEIQSRGLGMKVEVYDADGRPVVGKKGELVCSAPFPSMPVSFWQDPGDRRYRAAYFETYPGVWAHGDYAELRPEGGLVVHGRSDAVLNPGGVRIGTSEIYQVVERFDEVAGCLAVGQEWRGDVRIVLFLQLRQGRNLDEDLRGRIAAAIGSERTPRHVPARILQVADIPRTISGKIVELAVREVIHGRPVKNVDALANPEALDLFRDLPDLQDG